MCAPALVLPLTAWPRGPRRAPYSLWAADSHLHHETTVQHGSGGVGPQSGMRTEQDFKEG